MLFNDQAFYPIIKTDKFEETVTFYKELFGFDLVYGDEHYIVLQKQGLPQQQLGILDVSKDSRHLSEWAGDSTPTRGSVLNFLVENIRLAYQQFFWIDAEQLKNIKTSPRGQRFIAIQDPNGNTVTITELAKATGMATDEQNNEVIAETCTCGRKC